MEVCTLETLLNSVVYISLQSNRITKIEGLQSLSNLRELYLSHNGIEVIEGLENNVSYRNSERTECQTVHHVFCQPCKHAQQSLFHTFQ